MRIYHENEKIYFAKQGLSKVAYTDYDDNLWKKIMSTSWHIQKDRNGEPKYIRSSPLKKSLHQLVMEHWYGKSFVKEAYNKEFVIDHIDNDGFNCELNNLWVIPKKKNTAKGLTYDIDRKNTEIVAALNIFKDFHTGLFQMTIGFNKRCILKINECYKGITVLRLLYENDFQIVFSDAESILHGINEYAQFNLNKLNAMKWEVEEEVIIEDITEEEKGGCIVMRDGVPYIILNEHTIMNKIAPNKELYKNNK